jgi:hypothetical protein
MPASSVESSRPCAGTMNTLKLLFASGAEPAGLSPMPSLARTFGGNGDLMGAWFRESAQPSTFDAVPIERARLAFHSAFAFGDLSHLALGVGKLDREVGLRVSRQNLPVGETGRCVQTEWRSQRS